MEPEEAFAPALQVRLMATVRVKVRVRVWVRVRARVRLGLGLGLGLYVGLGLALFLVLGNGLMPIARERHSKVRPHGMRVLLQSGIQVLYSLHPGHVLYPGPAHRLHPDAHLRRPQLQNTTNSIVRRSSPAQQSATHPRLRGSSPRCGLIIRVG